MFSFFKKRNSNTQTVVPDWAKFFTSSEYTTFIEAVEKYFERKHLKCRIDDGMVLVDENTVGLDQLGLMNVAQMCKQNANTSFDETVNDHFETMIRIYEFDKEFSNIVFDFEKVKKYIGVRIHDSEYVTFLDKESTITRDVSTNLVAMLIFDLPESVINIKPEQIKAWNKDIEELFELGKRNIKEKYLIEPYNQQMQDATLWFAETQHFFAGNILFDLNDYSHLVGEKGALVSIPNRHMVIIYPIANLEVVGVLHNMLYLTKRMYEDGPGSIANNLYWYNNGILIDIPHKMENDKLIISPPQVFVDALNELGDRQN